MRHAAAAFAVALYAYGTLVTPSTVRADLVEDPCNLAATILCRFVPMAPDLLGDIDLTKDQPAGLPVAPPLPPVLVDPCVAGCI